MYSDLCQPWPYIWCGDLAGVNPAVTGSAVMAASEILWSATGRRFGNCAVKIRPCRKDCNTQWPQDTIWSDGVLTRGGYWGWPYPSLVNGIWLNLACGQCGDNCSCSAVSEVLLSETINEITSVTVDGVALLPNVDYLVYDGQRLVRMGGHEWPLCQDFTVTGGPGSWIIETSIGAPVPESGKMGVGALALEIAKACSGMECGLSFEVQKVVRQGVTMERIRAEDVLVDNLTGVFLADLFIRQMNPRAIQDRARAYSPDHMPARLQG